MWILVNPLREEEERNSHFPYPHKYYFDYFPGNYIENVKTKGLLHWTGEYFSLNLERIRLQVKEIRSFSFLTYVGYGAGVEQRLSPQLASLTAAQTLDTVIQLVLQLGQYMHWHQLLWKKTDVDAFIHFGL